MWLAMRSVNDRTAPASSDAPVSRVLYEVMCRERRTKDDRDAGAEDCLPIEVETDGHEHDRRARMFGSQCHSRGAGSERLQPAGRMADPLREDADGVASRKCHGNGGEHLEVLRCVDAVIHSSIDGDCPSAPQDQAKRPIEQRGLGQKPDVPSCGRPDHGRIEQ